MYEIGEIDKENLVELKVEIQSHKEEWIENVRIYNDPDNDIEDIW